MQEVRPVVAADLGGTMVKVGLVFRDRVLGEQQFETAADGSFEARLEHLARVAETLGRHAGIAHEQLFGIGLSLPGIIDSRQRRVLSINEKHDGVVGFDFDDWAARRLGLPVRLENDAHAACLGEWFYGAGKGVDDLVMVTLGTGFGTSVVIGGRPLRGRHFLAGVLGGHFSRAGGRPCNCGGVGCVEAETGTWALPAIIREHPAYSGSRLSRETVLDYVTLFRCAAEGDALALELRGRSLDLWGTAVVSLINAYDPVRVVMGGGVMLSGDLILSAVREAVARYPWTPWGTVEVVPAAHPGVAALLGMGALFYEQVDFM